MEPKPKLLVVYTREAAREELSALTEAELCFREPAALDLEAVAADADLVLVECYERLDASTWVTTVRAITNAPILALARDADEPALLSALAAGADDFVLLPARRSELLARVAARLTRRTRPANAIDEPNAEVLLELTRTLLSSLDFQEILYTLVSRIAEVIDVDRVSIVLAPQGSTFGYVVAASDDAKLTNLKLDLAKYPEIRHALKTKASLTIHDVGHHPLLDEVRRSVSDAGLTALTLIPIVWEDHSMGVLFVRARTRRGGLSRSQLRFCEVLTNATAIALRNARILQVLRDETQRDAQARLEAEKRLSVLERYGDLLASSADGLAAFDLDGKLLFANPAAHRILGHDPAQYVGQSLADFVPHSERRAFLELRRQLAAGQYPHGVDMRLAHKTGRSVIVNGSFSQLAGTEGTILLSFRDVTEERMTRDELVHTRNFLQSLIDASVDAIVAADMAGTIILFNNGAQELYGYTPDEAIGKMHVKTLYPGDGARDVGRMLRSRGHGGVGRLEPVRIEAVDRQGKIFPISLTAAIIYEGSRPSATFGIFTDLRERVRVEQQLAQAQEKLAITEKQALVAELAGATAHELNQPLTSVMGYAELLQRKLPGETPTHRAAEVIHREAERMAEIVRKIGRLTRYETKSYVGEQRILDIDRASSSEPPPEGDR